MRLARDQNNALLTDAFRAIRTVSDTFYVRIIMPAGVMEHCISHCMEIFYDLWCLKAVEIKRFVSYFSNFTRECLGSVHSVLCTVLVVC
jgi:hypothetical protein